LAADCDCGVHHPLHGHFDYDPRPLWTIPYGTAEEIFIGLRPRDFKLLRLLAGLRPRARCFWHLGVAYPANTWEYRWLFQNESIGLIVPSHYLKDKIVSLLPHLEHRMRVLHYGIDPVEVDAAWARTQLARRHGVAAETLFLGMFSRLVPWKGHMLLLTALRAMKEAGSKFYLWIVGSGKEEVRLKKYVQDVGLTEVVTFTGYQSDVVPWMAGIDVLLLPSENEPFGYVLLEGMALGKTVLAAASGGPLEIIEAGVDGVLVPSREPSVWADAILDAAQHPQRYAAMGRAAQLTVQRKFSRQQMVANFLHIVEG